MRRWKWTGGACVLLTGASLLVFLTACGGDRRPVTAPARASLVPLDQGRHLGVCRHSCLQEMRAMQREETRRYRAVVKICQGDPGCLRAAAEVHESTMMEMELDGQACIDACK